MLMKAVMLATLMLAGVFTQDTHDTVKIIMKSLKTATMKVQFKAFHYLFQKPYDLNSQEGLNRYKIFKSNAKFIEESNAKNKGFTLGINHFSDLTEEEYKSFLNPSISSNSKLSNLKKKDLIDLEDEEDNEINLGAEINIDWENELPPVKNQYGCGACWAFATITAVESCVNILNKHKSTLFSIQRVVDCDTQSAGCDGGQIENAINFIKREGVMLDNSYPFVTRLGKEKSECRKDLPSYYPVESFEIKDNQEDIRNLLKSGPVAVHIQANFKEFALYSGGVLDLSCNSPDHAIVLFGLRKEVIPGDDPKPKYVYILRNSYGDYWGEKGNFKHIAKNDACFINSFGVLPKCKPYGDPVDPPKPQESCIKFYDSCHGEGNYREICKSNSDLTDTIDIFKDSFSIDLGKFQDQKVVVYFRDHCRGSFIEVPRFIQCIDSVPMSIYIEDKSDDPLKCVDLYSEGCHAGEKKRVCDPETELGSFELRSFKLGSLVNEVRLISGDLAYNSTKSSLAIMESFFRKVNTFKILR